MLNQENVKSTLLLRECNLVHLCIAKGFKLNQTVKYLLSSFTLRNSYNQDKNVPECLLILNRNVDFNKGINKILKMIVMMPASAEDIASFMKERFPVGTLTCSNLLSLNRYLIKVTV